MTEPRSQPGAFQARPQEKHFHNRILLPAQSVAGAECLWSQSPAGAQHLPAAPPGEGTAALTAGRAQQHRASPAASWTPNSNHEGTGSLVVGDRGFAMGPAPHRAGMERGEAAASLWQSRGADPSPSPAPAPQRSLGLCRFPLLQWFLFWPWVRALLEEAISSRHGAGALVDPGGSGRGPGSAAIFQSPG